jgi:hypothetical protein
MPKSQKKIQALLLLVSLSTIEIFSQTGSPPRWEIGAGLSAFTYQGDLTPSRLGSFRTTKPGISLYLARIMSPSLAWRTHLTIGGLKGDDAKYDNPEYRKQRAFNFRTPVIELSQQVVWNPLRRNYKDKGISPYLFGGAGLSFLRIRRDWSNYNAVYFDEVSDVSARLAEDASHSLPKIIPVIPLGLGIRYGISSRLAVSAETAYRLVFTDYLDGFSQAANPKLNDHYHTVSVGVIYRVGKNNSLDCPPVRY